MTANGLLTRQMGTSSSVKNAIGNWTAPMANLIGRKNGMTLTLNVE